MVDAGEVSSRPVWRRLLPPRFGWLALLVAPSSYLLLVAWLLTAGAKLSILREISGIDGLWTSGAWAVAGDLLACAAVIFVFALAEALRPGIAALTSVTSGAVLVAAGANAAYLLESGEQLSWQSLSTGVSRVADVWNIAREIGAPTLLYGGLLAVVLTTLPVWIRRSRIGNGEWRALYAPEIGRARAHCSAFLAMAGAALLWLVPAPAALPVLQLGRSLVLPGPAGLHGRVARVPAADVGFAGYEPERIVAAPAIAALRAGRRPNVLVVVLESARFDHTELARPAAAQGQAPGTAEGKGTRTPALRALAARGASFHRARAVVPHTSKSVFNILCGRLPTLQTAILETADLPRSQCLASILAEAGYRTAFFQSALGSFEDRPRLVHKLGFDHFAAWEDIRGEPLGYLASDDESLAPAFASWLESTPEPFFATLLTSATHHPYRLGAETARRAAAEGLPMTAAEDRYARLLEAQDRMLGRVMDDLRKRGRLADTLVVVVGDHGEGFGDKGVRQHDNNFFEEGLHVPLVFAGPGVPVVEIHENVSLSDVTPSLLGLLGAPVSADARATLAGIDVLSEPVPPKRLLPFVCWFHRRCSGFVSGRQKVVITPDAAGAYYFDLDADPEERMPRPLPQELYEAMEGVRATIASHQTRGFRPRYGEVRYGAWHCPARHKGCTHPRGAAAHAAADGAEG
jgi:arylsulfatase A-like enzyme